MNATDALRALEALGARRMLPMHFETFPASFEPARTARETLATEARRRGFSDRITVLAEGASLRLECTGEPGGGRQDRRPDGAPCRAA